MTVSEWIWLDRTKISSTADRSVSGLSQTQGPVQARALALKGKLFRQGAQNHFLSVCIYNSNRFVDCLTAATSNRRETWVKKHGTDGILCRQVPVPGYGAWILPSERVPVPGYRAQVFVRAPLKCYPCPSVEPWHQAGRGLTECRSATSSFCKLFHSNLQISSWDKNSCCKNVCKLSNR